MKNVVVVWYKLTRITAWTKLIKGIWKEGENVLSAAVLSSAVQTILPSSIHFSLPHSFPWDKRKGLRKKRRKEKTVRKKNKKNPGRNWKWSWLVMFISQEYHGHNFMSSWESEEGKNTCWKKLWKLWCVKQGIMMKIWRFRSHELYLSSDQKGWDGSCEEVLEWKTRWREGMREEEGDVVCVGWSVGRMRE